MRAITHLGDGRHVLSERAQPDEPPRDGAIVEVAAAGICGSDLLILSRPPRHPAALGIVLGHEFGGTVRAVGADVRHVRPGDRVVIDPAVGCGTCPWCRRGQPEGCPDQVHLGITVDGGFTPYAVVPGWAVVPLHADVPWARAVLNEPVGVVLAGLARVPPQPGESAAVLGAGPIGLLFCALLSSMGVAPLVAYEPRPRRRELALACGATHALEPEAATPAGYREGSGARIPPSLVVDATGFLLDRAVELVDHGGRVLCVGYDTSARPAINVARLVDGTIAIRGTAGGFHQAARARDLLASGRLPVDAVVTDELPLDEVDHALAEMRAGRAGKVVLRP
jgi:(R,R)-butanediol dehydrogenase/meso-butanediol dehydrogenase/diacetyl reductase